MRRLSSEYVMTLSVIEPGGAILIVKAELM